MVFKTGERKLLGSPLFSKKNTVLIASNGVFVFDFGRNGESSQKYSPFDNLTITNDSTENIEVFVNQDSSNSFLVPSGTIKNFDKLSIPALSSVLITNVGDSDIAIGLIRVNVQNEVVSGQNIVSSFTEKLIRGNSNAI